MQHVDKPLSPTVPPPPPPVPASKPEPVPPPVLGPVPPPVWFGLLELAPFEISGHTELHVLNSFWPISSHDA
jgi:hypothetical protein